MTSFLHPTGRHRGLRGGDGIAGELVGIDGCGSAQFRGGRYARPARAGIESDEPREGAGRRPRNRDGHRPSGRCRCGHRTELEPAVRRSCGDILGRNGIGGAQGQLRGGGAIKGRWRSEGRVQHPNALARGRAAIGYIEILFPPDGTGSSCPRRDTPDEHVTSANGRRSDTGWKGIFERQVSGQQISLDGELLQTAQVLDPQRKLAGQPVTCQVQVCEVGQVSEFGRYRPSETV